jgi:2-polyprenyl-6-methoxyphenol hydroxylase-like FAD-dependent oxidoreductase
MESANGNGNSKHFLIVGAGIAGCTLALRLHKAGFKVDVFERAPEVKELGLGIQISPAATEILYKLELQEELESKGTIMESFDKFRSVDGSVIRERGVGKFGGFPHHQIGIHRGELQLIIYNHAVKLIGAEHFHLDHEGSHYEQDGTKVTLHFTNRKTATGDALVGCDGIRSNVRKQMYPNEEARFTGWVIYRGVPKVSDLTIYKPKPRATTYGNSASYIAYYPIKKNAVVSWGACCRIETGPTLESWGAKAEKKDVAAWRDWNEEVRELIDASPEIFKFEIYDRDPTTNWTDGVVTLLGDAAHPMLPFLGQGGSSAITDAEILSTELESGKSIHEAFVAYQAKRIPFTAELVEINRNRGGIFEEYRIVEELGYVPKEWPTSYARKLY